MSVSIQIKLATFVGYAIATILGLYGLLSFFLLIQSGFYLLDDALLLAVRTSIAVLLALGLGCVTNLCSILLRRAFKDELESSARNVTNT